jgi:transcriptional antiterminator NusG
MIVESPVPPPEPLPEEPSPVPAPPAVEHTEAEAPAATLPEPTPEKRVAKPRASKNKPPVPPAAPPNTPDGTSPAPDGPEPEGPTNKHWYVVKVQSGREESIKDAIERRVKIEGLEEFFGQVIIPVERVAEMRNGKRVVRERKLYPGYLMVEVEFNDRILYLFRETSGVGDFVGGGLNRPPLPMSAREVERMLGGPRGDKETPIPVKPKFDRGDRVKVREGTFSGMEGEVKELLEAKNLVRVELTIFGRPVPVELEYWQVEVV